MIFAKEDIDSITLQLGRTPRGVIEVANRCSCGKPTAREWATKACKHLTRLGIPPAEISMI